MRVQAHTGQVARRGHVQPMLGDEDLELGSEAVDQQGVGGNIDDVLSMRRIAGEESWHVHVLSVAVKVSAAGLNNTRNKQKLILKHAMSA
eukprot:6209300-Pleurochrysis_carterae.AAC.1